MKKIYIFTLLIVALLSGCGTVDQSNESTEVVTKESTPNVMGVIDAVNKLDWKGKYVGVLPCDDCDKLEAEVTLENNKYSRKLIYRGKSNTPLLSQGLYKWNEEGSELTLKSFKGKNQLYRVVENALIFVEADSTAGAFRLVKQSTENPA